MKWNTKIINERTAIVMSDAGTRITIRRIRAGESRKMPMKLNRWHIRVHDELNREVAEMYSEKRFIIQVVPQAPGYRTENDSPGQSPRRERKTAKNHRKSTKKPRYLANSGQKSDAQGLLVCP